MSEAVKSGSERLLLLLTTLARLKRLVSINDLVAETGIARSSLYRQLSLLKEWGFVIDYQNRFMPGPVCISLASSFEECSYLKLEAFDELNRLSMHTKESVGLLVTANNQVVCLEMVESKQPLRCSFVKGSSLPLNQGASAKALMAFMNKQDRNLALNQMIYNGALTEDARTNFELELNQIKKSGYASSNSKVDAGVWGSSAPIFQFGNMACGVITLMAPIVRASGREEILASETLTTAKRISLRLQQVSLS